MRGIFILLQKVTKLLTTYAPFLLFLVYTLFAFSRLAKYQAFKSFSKRILVATDLFGRGMDIERVNIVFNYDMPENSDTYLHRVRTAVITRLH